jgi:hypothetical protein
VGLFAIIVERNSKSFKIKDLGFIFYGSSRVNGNGRGSQGVIAQHFV